MKKYSIPVVSTVVGVLCLLFGSLIGEISIQGLKVPIGDLLNNIAATFISLAILALLYEILGGEPITNLIEHLIKLQSISRNADVIGVEEIVDARRRFDYERIHKDLQNSKEMFIASRTFDSIKYGDVKLLFREHLEKNQTNSIKILLNKDSTKNIQMIIDFRGSLPESQQQRFEIRSSDKINCCIYGSDYKIYATPYLIAFRGEESPSILCCNKSRNSIYHIYREEYYAIWKVASSL